MLDRATLAKKLPLGLLAILMAVLPSGAADAEKPWFEQLTVNAFVSTSYSYNFNRPKSGLNGYRVFDFDDNSFKFDLAEIILQKPVSSPGDVGFRVDLGYGTSIPWVLSGGEQEDVHQGYVSWMAPVGSGLRLDFGKFITHHGYELIDGYDGYNDNATRSFLFGYAIPFTHTGLRATYAFNGKVSAMLMVVNGWDNATDNNASKSVGAQVTLTPTGAVTVYLNGMIGPEQAGNNSNQRTMADVAATWKATKRLTLGLNLDHGTEGNAVPVSEDSARDASWSGAAVYARFAVTPKFALAARVEQFDDRDGSRTGTAQRLREITLTPEYRVNPHLVLRGDLRTDNSDVDVFENESGDFTRRRQTTALFNALVVF